MNPHPQSCYIIPGLKGTIAVTYPAQPVHHLSLVARWMIKDASELSGDILEGNGGADCLSNGRSMHSVYVD